MVKKPLVTVICLSFNHEAYVLEALNSILSQTYTPIQLIVVDDASHDQSASIIEQFCLSYPEIIFIKQEENLGNCTSFNRALSFAEGKYLIDLAADDVLLPDRISKQVEFFEFLPDSVGVIHHRAMRIDTQGEPLREWPATRKFGCVQGQVLEKVLQFTCIATPTMMFRSSTMKDLGGYNPDLSFEDFDFWIRSALRCEYGYQDEILTLWREVPGSMSTQDKEPMLKDVFEVLAKCRMELTSDNQVKAWHNGVKFYQRLAWYLGYFQKSKDFWRMQEKKSFLSTLIFLAAYLRLPVKGLYTQYRKWIKIA